MIDLSIVILSFNTKEFLEKCLKSIKNSDLGKYKIEIIIVDNNSSDDSVKMVKEQFKNINIVENAKNYGFAKGNNIGIKKAKGRYILFLNPDTEVSKSALKTVLDFLEENKDVGAATVKLVDPQGVLDEPSHRGFPTPWNSISHFLGLEKVFPKSKLFSGYTMGWLKNSKNPHEVDSISGASFCVRREAGEEVGWWDEDYFWYGEDIDFCYRLKKAGYKIYFIPDSSILHYRGAASGIVKRTSQISTASKESKIRSAKASTAAMEIFYKKHYENTYPAFIKWIVLGGIKLLSAYRVVKYSI